MEHKQRLFLHWGPGGNCNIERIWFNPGAPALFRSVDWWNQPGFASRAERPFTRLLQESLAHLESAATEEPIDLIAHSFGAQLAVRLAKLRPDLVRSIVIFGGSASSQLGYARLGAKLAALYSDAGLAEAAKRFAASTRPAVDFPPLVEAITRHPDFMFHYWGSRSRAARARYFELAEEIPILDFNSFMATMLDYFEHSQGKPEPVPASIPVEIHLGREDPFIDPLTAEAEWKQIAPQARFAWSASGHFIPFETFPPSG